MFGLFNSNEKKLESRLKEEITNTAITLFNESGFKGTPVEGTILLGCISDTKDACLRRKHQISSYYKVPLNKTVEIINKTAKLVANELVNI